MAIEARWHSRWVAGDGVRCPACGAGFALDIAFDNAPRWCPACKKTLVEWFFYSLPLLIDPEKAPPLVKSIIDFIDVLADFESEEVMLELHHLLDRQPPWWVPPGVDRSWYSKWVVAEGDEGTKCPCCRVSLPRDREFNHALRRCLSCTKELVNWDFTSMVLTIDSEKAPPLVKHIITFLRPMTACEAEEVMRELYQLFDRMSSPPMLVDPQRPPNAESDVQRSRALLRSIARAQLDEHFRDLNVERKEELAASLVRQWQAYEGHAGLLSCGNDFWFQVVPGEEGGYRASFQAEAPRFKAELQRANMVAKDIPELLHRLSLSQSLTCRTVDGMPTWLQVNPRERTLVVEDLVHD
jgi:predicted amidophosphoribosyltransferase